MLFQINRCTVNTIWFRFDKIRFRKDLSACSIWNLLVSWRPNWEPPSEPLDTIEYSVMFERFQGGLNRFPMMPKNVSLSDSCTPVCCTHREFFFNLVKSTRNQIVFTIFRIIWIQTKVRLDLNENPFGSKQSENGNYNLIWVHLPRLKKYFSVWTDELEPTEHRYADSNSVPETTRLNWLLQS